MGEPGKLSEYDGIYMLLPILNRIALSVSFSLEKMSMIFSGAVLDSFSCPSFLWLPAIHLGVEWSIVKKGVGKGRDGS